LCPWERHLKGH